MTDALLGRFADLPNADYHADLAVGSSGLKLLKQSPLHYWAAYLDPEREKRETTPAQRIGTAWHTAVFEPERFDGDYIEIPEGLDRRTKEGKALWAEIEASGRVPMTVDDMRQIHRMAVAGRSHPAARVFFDLPGGVAEESLFWADEDTGLRCKIRPDYAVAPCEMFPNGLLVDGKTGEDMSSAGFARYAWNWDLHIQAAWYSDGYQRAMGTSGPPEFLWLAQEKAAPYATACYAPGADFLELGRRECRRLLRLLAECLERDRWPGYPERVQALVLPAWAQKVVDEGVRA